MTEVEKSNKDTIYVTDPTVCIDCGRSKQPTYSTGAFLCEECQDQQFKTIRNTLEHVN